MAIPKIVAGDIVQVTIESEALGQQLQNVLHYRAKVGAPDSEYFVIMANLAEAIAEITTTSPVLKMLPLMGANTLVRGVRCQRIGPLRSPYLFTQEDMAGLHADDCDASNLAAVITKVPDVAGRGKTGTFHLGGLANTTYALGFMTPAAITLLGALADKLNDPMLTVGGSALFEPVVYNPGSGSVGTANLIEGTFVKSTLRVMRRRTVGLGI